MTLRLLALAAALLATTAAAQTAPPARHPPPASTPARSAPSGSNARAIEKAKALGKQGVEKVAPKLGRAEKLVRKAEPEVDKVIDFAVEKAGLAPAR